MTMAQYVVRRQPRGFELVRVHPIESPGAWWIAGGALLAYFGMKRRSLPGLAMAIAGGAMMYHGSGACAPSDAAGELAGSTGRSAADDTDDPPAPAGDGRAANGTKVGPSYQNDGRGRSSQLPCDDLEEASMQSFPASDPPAI